MLNRDVNNQNKNLYSTNVNSKVDATLDTRLLSVDGINQIKDDYYNATAITNAIEQIVTSDKVGITDFFSETQKNVDVYNGMKSKIANDEELSKQLQDPNLNPTDKQNMLKEVALSVMQELGYVSNDVKLISTTQTGANGIQVKGYFDPITQTSFVNDKYNDSTYQLISSLGHEISHDMDKQDGIFVANNEGQNIYATNFGNNLAYYTNGALGITNGGSLAQTNSHNSGIVTSQPSIFNDYTLVKNNLTFASVDKSAGDDLTQQEAIDMVNQAPNVLAMYENVNVEGGWDVGTKDAVAKYVADNMPSLTEEEKQQITNEILLKIDSNLFGIKDTVDSVTKILNGDYSEAYLTAIGIVVSRVPFGSKTFHAVEEALKKTDSKIVDIDGIKYGKNSSGDVVEIKVTEADIDKLKNRDDWTADQIKQANIKKDNLKKAASEGKLTVNSNHGVTQAERKAVTTQYRKDLEDRIESIYANNPTAKQNALKKLDNADIDHMIDLQVGGENARGNLKALDKSVNRSYGKQLDNILKNLLEGN